MERELLRFQREEITEHIIYKLLSERFKGNNRKILSKISEDELKHYNFWKNYTGKDVKPNYFTVFRYMVIQFIFGITFALKLLEGGEESAQKVYNRVLKEIPEARDVVKDEVLHERALLNLIDEERIGYISSMVLGLNDALVELTGALAGFTLSMQNRKIIILAGFITGIAAALSMSASEYLSTRSESETTRSPVKSAFYTGVAYLITVFLLLIPYIVFPNYYLSLGFTLIIVILIISVFTFYVSVVHGRAFFKSFFEMLIISLGVAGISFLIGFLIRHFFNIEI